ncbi:hypothetical protein BDP27DRAFT_1345304 [Rhodocollybia butyracea]|uniref:Uncharacterized protein n=1 Tax=Rhodocollybia butyracea TaxID=206335 RepID=A0A9P5P604_9AGAR|nr:hypothetical protein BDP27DRAFT_1345304 [Rhodocollybia butyracea]
MLGNWGPKASWCGLRHVRIGFINSHFNVNSHRHITSKFARQPSFRSSAPSRSNLRPSSGFSLYKPHNTALLYHVGAQEYATFRGSTINWRKRRRKILWGGIGAIGYYIYYELSLRWPGYDLLVLDEDHFPRIDWDSPLESMSYFRALDLVCFRYQILQQLTVTFSQQERETKEKIFRSIDVFVVLPREELDRIVAERMDYLQREEIDSLVSTLVRSQCQMYEIMKEAAHQVHGLLLEHPPQWKPRTLGYDLHKIAMVVLEANNTLLRLALENGTCEIVTKIHTFLRNLDNEQASNAIKTGNEEYRN